MNTIDTCKLVFSHLDIISLFRCARVCKRWNAIVYRLWNERDAKWIKKELRKTANLPVGRIDFLTTVIPDVQEIKVEEYNKSQTHNASVSNQLRLVDAIVVSHTSEIIFLPAFSAADDRPFVTTVSALLHWLSEKAGIKPSLDHLAFRLEDGLSFRFHRNRLSKSNMWGMHLGESFERLLKAKFPDALPEKLVCKRPLVELFYIPSKYVNVNRILKKYI
jgi:F-box associated protein